MASGRPLRRYLLAALPAALVASAVLGPARAEPSADPGGEATATFSDTFDGPAGSAVDSSKWTLETGDNVNNHERQYYTSGAKNAALDGQGHLVITAREENPSGYQCWYGSCEYTSARLNTAGKFSAKYGHVEARMKIPRGQGMWPAFWMLGTSGGGWPDSGEVDVMENVGKNPSAVYGTIHGPGYSGSGGIGDSYSLPGGGAFADAFHTYAIDWAPDSISWSVDGKVYQRRTPDDLGGKNWVFNAPFFLILNLAVGGDWPGEPDGSTQFPQQLVVDSVSVTTGGSPTATAGTTGTVAGTAATPNNRVATPTGRATIMASTPTTGATATPTGRATTMAATPTTTPAGTPTTTPTGAPSPGATGGSTGGTRPSVKDAPIRNLAGKCVDVADPKFANGAPVQLYDCNGTTAQSWTIGSDGTVRAAGKCLDVMDDGTAVQLLDCTRGSDQKWTLTGAREIVNRQTNKCLEVTDADAGSGTRVQTGACSRGTNQKWKVG
ncbi:hypothetical protein ACE1SV_71070 [Streptomyces sp. E-15]